MDCHRYCCTVVVLLGLVWAVASAQPPESRVATFDRYDPTMLSYEVAGVEGEYIDPRTLHVSWEVNDLTLPGNGDLDIVVSRSFGRVSHTPSEMGHWYLGLPRIQIPTSPWRVPIDPASPVNPTFYAAWNNLYARIDYGRSNICAEAGNFVDPYLTLSLTNQLRGGIFFAAPITLYVPGEGHKLLLDKNSQATHFPATADYVTTDNWYARCLQANNDHPWGGFEVVSPHGTRYRFNLIKHLVPGDYALGSSGGWIEMVPSIVTDVHGNTLEYRYGPGPDGTGLLKKIVASDGRKVEFIYHPDSAPGVDVQGSPLALITALEYEVNDRVERIEYSYCDFSSLYILGAGCGDIDLGPDSGLPVLKKVALPDGTKTSYAYNGSMYAANVFLDWGGFEFLLSKVTLPAGGEIAYEYHPGYSAVFQNTDSPAPRVKKRATSGPFVEPGIWNYTYALADHIETTTVRSSGRLDTYEFFEGVGTYEYEVARRQGSYVWPDTSPVDYEDVMGRLRRHTVSGIGSGKILRTTEWDYGVPASIGRSWYGGNWLGWPTVVVSQVRPARVTQTRVTDNQAGLNGYTYTTGTALGDFDPFGNPLRVFETGHDGRADNSWRYRETAYRYRNTRPEWVIGQVEEISRDGYSQTFDYYPSGLLQERNIHGVVTQFDYHPNGELHKQRWLRAGVEHENTFLDYVRGQPQLERRVIDPVAGLYAEHRREVNALGAIDSELTPDGSLYQYSYLSGGWLANVTPPLATPLEFSYNFEGGLLANLVKAQGSRSVTHKLDGLGRIRVTLEAGQAAAGLTKYARLTRFDEQGRKRFESLPFLWQAPEYGSVAEGISYEYDKLGRVVLESHTVDGSQRSWCYMQSCNTGDYANYFDATLVNGYIITNERGYQSAYEHRSFGHPDQQELTRIVQQVSKATESGGVRFAVTEIDRDLWGNVTAVHQGDGVNKISRYFSYDSSLHLVAENHPETGETRHAYDEAGNRISSTLASGAVIERSYDGMNRMTSEDYPDLAAPVVMERSAENRLLAADNGFSRWEYRYDAEGRLATEKLTLADKQFSLRYEYNPLGNLTALTYPDGRRFKLQPDGFGRPQRFGDMATDIRYSPDGAMQNLVYGNGLRLSVEQNGRQLPRSRVVTDPDRGVLLDMAYGYDESGNLVGVNDGNADRYDLWLGYDGLSRLTSASGFWGGGQIDYDFVGNIAAKSIGGQELTYTYDSNNRLSQLNALPAGAFDYTYDDLGNVLADSQRTYDFNSASQLVSLDGSAGARYEYDANGRRTRLLKDGLAWLDVYNRKGLLLFSDKCASDAVGVQYYHVGRELIAAEEVPCEASCHS